MQFAIGLKGAVALGKLRQTVDDLVQAANTKSVGLIALRQQIWRTERNLHTKINQCSCCKQWSTLIAVSDKLLPKVVPPVPKETDSFHKLIPENERASKELVNILINTY